MTTEVAMNFQWILLALFLVAIISGASKARRKSMLRNTLRFGALVLAFLITLFLQICGVFQRIVITLVDALTKVGLMVDLSEIPAEMAGVMDFIFAFAATLISPIFFFIVFFLLLWILRIIVFFIARGFEKKKERASEQKFTQKKSAPAKKEEIISTLQEDTTAVEASEENGTILNSEEESASATMTVDSDDDFEDEVQASAIPQKTKRRKKRFILYPECAWKRTVSFVCGIIGSLLMLGILFTPFFYLMSYADAATAGIENSDADDSIVYQVIAAADENIISPFNDSFFGRFYSFTGVSKLMTYTVKAGGKIELDNNKTVYADDVIKNVLTHTVSLAAQATSEKSECKTAKADLNAIVGDPYISSTICDIFMLMLNDVELEEPIGDTFSEGLSYGIISYYKNADKATIEKSMMAVSSVAGAFLEKGILAHLIAGSEDFDASFIDKELVDSILGDPTVTSVLSEILVSVFNEIKIETPEDKEFGNVLGYGFLTYYKNANAATFEKNLQAVRTMLCAFLDSGILEQLIEGDEEIDPSFIDKDLFDATLGNPAIVSILSEVLVYSFEIMELEEPSEEDVEAGLLYGFLSHYKNADQQLLENDLKALNAAAGTLIEKGIFAKMLDGDETELKETLTEKETLSDLIVSISGLSSYGATVQNIFEYGIKTLGEALEIPENDAEAYDDFIENLLIHMEKDDSTQFDMGIIQYYIYTCAQNGYKVSAANGVKGHKQFLAYVAHWEKVQAAFSIASEDKSYGYFTMEINGELYIYDKNEKKIIIYSDEVAKEYKDKFSPIAGLINALTRYSTNKQYTKENLYTILNAYTSSTAVTSSEINAKSVALATEMLNRNTFTTESVTIEKLLDSTSFDKWDEESRAEDSRICIDIVFGLLDVVEKLETMDQTDEIDRALMLVDQFTLLGRTMDKMQQTTCIKKLPPLLIEGLVKNETFASFMKPSIVFQINDIVANSDSTYEDSMKQIGGILKWVINSLGGEF